MQLLQSALQSVDGQLQRNMCVLLLRCANILLFICVCVRARACAYCGLVCVCVCVCVCECVCVCVFVVLVNMHQCVCVHVREALLPLSLCGVLVHFVLVPECPSLPPTRYQRTHARIHSKMLLNRTARLNCALQGLFWGKGGTQYASLCIL
jgi:hypothetical protein